MSEKVAEQMLALQEENKMLKEKFSDLNFRYQNLFSECLIRIRDFREDTQAITGVNDENRNLRSQVAMLMEKLLDHYKDSTK